MLRICIRACPTNMDHKCFIRLDITLLPRPRARVFEFWFSMICANHMFEAFGVLVSGFCGGVWNNDMGIGRHLNLSSPSMHLSGISLILLAETAVFPHKTKQGEEKDHRDTETCP